MEYVYNGEPLGQDAQSSSSFCTPSGSPLVSTLSLDNPDTYVNQRKTSSKRRIKSEPIRKSATENDVKGNHVTKPQSNDDGNDMETMVLIHHENDVKGNHVTKLQDDDDVVHNEVETVESMYEENHIKGNHVTKIEVMDVENETETIVSMNDENILGNHVGESRERNGHNGKRRPSRESRV